MYFGVSHLCLSLFQMKHPPPQYHYQPGQPGKQTYQFQAAIPHSQKRVYQYDFSYRFEWVRTPESELATWKATSQDSLHLTDQTLRLTRKGISRFVRTKELRAFKVSFRRLMLPVVVGGFFLPLAIVGLVSNYMSYWTGTGIMIVSAMILYYGLRGTYQVDVEMTGNRVSFFVDEYTADLQAFVAKANWHLNFLKKN